MYCILILYIFDDTHVKTTFITIVSCNDYNYLITPVMADSASCLEIRYPCRVPIAWPRKGL